MIQGIIIRGTTPTEEFELPCSANEIKDLRIIFGQSKKGLFTKYRNECELKNNKVLVSLSQDETYLFNPNKKLYVEIRVQTYDNKIISTKNPTVFLIADTMDEEIMES